MKRPNRVVPFMVIVVILVIAAALGVLLLTQPRGTERTAPDSTETIGEREFRHYFTTVDGIRWHYVEAGAVSGQPIVFLHGIPSAWYAWHRVMAPLADTYRLIAVDLKGLGLTAAPEGGSFNASVVADEIAALMTALNVPNFTLVSHEWGSVVGSYLAAQHPDRVAQFVRISMPLTDGALNQINTLKANPALGKLVLADATGFVSRMYTGKMTSLIMANVTQGGVLPIPDEDVARIIKEFSYAGIPDAIVRYYSETPPPSEYRTIFAGLAAKTTMPVLLLQGGADRIQPADFYTDAAAIFPNARLQVLEGVGHLPMLEQPQAVADAIRGLLR